MPFRFFIQLKLLLQFLNNVHFYLLTSPIRDSATPCMGGWVPSGCGFQNITSAECDYCPFTFN